jgi:hypothetical protein
VYVQNKDLQNPLELLQSLDFAQEMKGKKKYIMVVPTNKGLTSQLVADMKQAINCQDYSDFQILVEDKVIYTHKILLYTRCKYFKALFDKNPETNSLQVENFSYEVIMLMVEFIYTDHVKPSATILFDLSKAATHFQLETLVSICGNKKVILPLFL